MNKTVPFLCALLIATVSLAGTISVTKRSPAVDPKFTTPKFTVPAGFTVELVASSRTKTAIGTLRSPNQCRRDEEHRRRESGSGIQRTARQDRCAFGLIYKTGPKRQRNETERRNWLREAMKPETNPR